MPRMNYRIEVPRAGFAYVAITLFVMIAAINSQTNLLFIAFGAMLGGLLVSLVMSWLVLRRIEVKRLVAAHAIAGELSEVHYLVTNRKRWLACFALNISEVDIDGRLGKAPDAFAFYIPPGGTATAMAQLLPLQRGRVTLRCVRIACTFPFGFVRQVRHVPRVAEVAVYPRVGSLNRQLALRYREAVTSGSMTSNMRGGQDEFYGLREYRPGDNVRSIHWRRTARTGQVMVREMTSNAPPQMTVVLNLRGSSGEGEDIVQAERAIELAATLICYGFFENFAVGLAIAGLPDEEMPLPIMGREARNKLLYRLAVLDVRSVRANIGGVKPNRLASQSEWVVVTMSRRDEVRDIVPGNVEHTVLALDDPESDTWVHFASGEHTRRLLHE